MSEKIKNVRFALVALLLMFAAAVQAQTVKGNVKDKGLGEAVIGATVMEQGTTNGTTTDFDGNFTINLKGKSRKLVISYIGMKSQTIDVAGKSQINVILEDENTTLNDVVVIGYGTVRKKDLTGAVAQVSSKQIADIPVTDVSQALTGKMSGVNVTVADGAPDAESNIRVRGGGSLSQDNSPLYIVDGFEVSSISDISPAEIETIDVLKDASSTAIYGAKGANGVIIITTKSGGKDTTTKLPKINFNSSWSWKKATKFQKVLSPYDYARLKFEALSADLGTSIDKRTAVGQFKDLDTYKSVQGLDYQDAIFGRTGFQQTYNVNVSGGDKKLNYNITYAHDDQDAIMLKSGSSKNNLSGKIKAQMNKYITLDAQVRFSWQKVQGLGSGADTNESNASNSIVANAVSWSPLEGIVIDEDDEEAQTTTTYTPLQRLQDTYKEVTNNKQTYNLGLTWKPWKHWTFKTEFSYNKTQKNTDQVWGPMATANSKYGYSGKPQSRLYDTDTWGWTSKNYLTYDNRKLFKGRDNINVVFGMDLNAAQTEAVEHLTAAYPTTYTINDVIASRGTNCVVLPDIASTMPKETMQSFYSRINYGLKDGKYLFTFTMRADGSSFFRSGNRWGFFPAGSVAWRVSDEPWMKGAEDWLSNFKLRLSLGMAGNNRIKTIYTLQSYEKADNTANFPYFSRDDRAEILKRTSSALYNPNLKWETTITRNFGIDYGFLNGRISGSFEFYWNTTKDLLMAVTIPGNSGYTVQYQNFGQTSNKGVEFSTNIAAIDTKKFSLNANLNIAYNQQKIDELNTSAGEWQSSNFAGSRIANYEDFRTVAGGSLGEVYGYKTDGFYTIARYAEDGTYLGGDLMLDNNKRWQIVPESNANHSYLSTSGTLYPGVLKLAGQDDEEGQYSLEQNKVKLGNTIPKWTGGFGFDGVLKNKWGNIDFTVFFNFSLGNQIVNATKIANTFDSSAGKMRYNLTDKFTEGTYYTWIDPVTGYNLGRPNTDVVTYYGSTAAVAARIDEINTNATVYNPVGTSRMFITEDALEDASFLRLQNVTVGYSLPKSAIKKLHLSNVRLYFTAYNLACITKYKGADPEVSTNSNPMCPGIDYAAYPKTRSYTLGLNVAF